MSLLSLSRLRRSCLHPALVVWALVLDPAPRPAASASDGTPTAVRVSAASQAVTR